MTGPAPKRGGRRPGAGRPATTGRRDGPQTVVRWSPAELEAVLATVGSERGPGKGESVASWLRDLALKQIGYPAEEDENP